MSSSLLDNLNDPQRKAAGHVDGPLLILAGAGSGKTRVITHRIAYLIREIGVHPYHILAVTFTNKAAGEMRERVSDLLGGLHGGLSMGTFHAICARMLREHIGALGYKTTFSIYDSTDQLSLVKAVMKDKDISPERFQPQAILAQISRYKQDLLEPHQIGNQGYNIFANIATRVYEIYQQRLKEASALDFDDLLNLAVKLLRTQPEVLEIYNKRWQYILVDEYQDTNKAQYTLLRLLTQTHDNLCVVGDDDQSIYRWRGANIENILSFERDYPNTHVVKLEQNYRSSTTILNIAHSVISRNEQRKEKQLWSDCGKGEKSIVYAAETETREAQYVVDEIVRLESREGMRYGDCAIFYRTNAQSRAIEQQLVMQRIPYGIVGGLKFHERKEIKDIMAYLRVLLNPDDEISLLRIINTPARGIGAVTVNRLRAYANGQSISLFEAMRRAESEKLLSAAPTAKVLHFVEMIDAMREGLETLPLTDLVPHVMGASGYLDMLHQDSSEQAKDRLANLNELVNEVSEFTRQQGEEATLLGFLERTALVADIDGFEAERDRVVLMTVHTAKGLEFPVVFLTGMEEQLFPHSRALENDDDLSEERRLAYVGITRSMKKLYLTLARTRMVFGHTRRAQPSRFLSDIPPEFIEDHAFLTKRSVKTFSFGGNRSEQDHFDVDDDVGFDSQDSGFDEPVYDADAGEISQAITLDSKVYHPSFGVGKVAMISGTGDSARVTVMFPGMPLKKIVAKFLQPVN